jgi:3-isopropylmalate dehydrogenase
MLLAHLGLDDASARVERAVAADLAERGSSPRSTSAVGDAIASRL